MSNETFNLDFSGSVPKNYDHYLGPMFFEPYAVEIAQRVDASSVKNALEIGCGTGRVTKHLRNALHATATLTASDLSEGMLKIAMQKLNGSNIDWQIIDAQQLPFDDNSLDLVVCAFALMFVPDRSKAYSEVFRVLRPGGTFIFTTWDKLENNEASHVFRTIVKEYFGDSLPETYKLPFSLHDPEMLESQLEKIGFSNANVEVVKKFSVCPSAKTAAEGLINGGTLYNEIIKRNPAWVGEITSAVESQLSKKYGDSPLTTPMKALLAISNK
jgi:ubiquinone/menaquinone biosynthesis C-methylase UbiE